MNVKGLNQFSRDKVESLLTSVPFYKAVKQQDNWQFEVLLQHSHLVEAGAGEQILQRGDGDQYLYFVLKGRLAVFAEAETDGEPLNYITPGEAFGDLAMLTEQPRTADVCVASDCREALLFATSYRAFGALTDFSTLSLSTKLTYFRNMVHSLRWKLEVYRMQQPQSELAKRHHQVRLYTGGKDTQQELEALYQQAQELAQLLLVWNQTFGALSFESAGPDDNLRDVM